MAKAGFICALVLSSACGDASTGDGEAASGTGPIPVERFERALAEATCAAAERCELGSFVSQLRQDGRCVEAIERAVSGAGLNRYVAAVQFGELGYDPLAARACLDSFAGKCPPPFDLVARSLEPLAWCPEAFQRRSCVPVDKEPWQPPLADGALCRNNGHTCAAGSTCSFASNTCLPCAQASEADAPYSCRPPSDDVLPVLTSMYLVDRPAGSSCDIPEFRAQCNPGVRCVIADLTCTAPRPTGEPCPTGEECAGRCDAQSQLCKPECE